MARQLKYTPFKPVEKRNLSLSRVYTGIDLSIYHPQTDAMEVVLPKPDRSQEKIKIFSHPMFGSLEAVLVNQEPWFMAHPIAEMLGYYSTERMTRRLDEDELVTIRFRKKGEQTNVSRLIQDAIETKATKLSEEELYSEVRNSYPGEPETSNNQRIFISESGLYNAIIGSNKPEAKRFKKWITAIVLPSIRKLGYFSLDDYFLNTEGKHGITGYGHLIPHMKVREFVHTYDLNEEMFYRHLYFFKLIKTDKCMNDFYRFKWTDTAEACNVGWHKPPCTPGIYGQKPRPGTPMINIPVCCKILNYPILNKIVSVISQSSYDPEKYFHRQSAFGDFANGLEIIG